jgi:hypothetical protein
LLGSADRDSFTSDNKLWKITSNHRRVRELTLLVSNQLDTYAPLLGFGSVHALKHSVEKGSLVNATHTEVKDFYALVTLGLNPDGTPALDTPRAAACSPVIAKLAVPAKKKENA